MFGEKLETKLSVDWRFDPETEQSGQEMGQEEGNNNADNTER